MDFDSIISFLLILLFFVFPTLLKRFNKKKKTAAPNVAGRPENQRAKKLSLFEKLGDQIREYAKTLEQEAAKGKKTGETQENVWEHLAGDEDFQANDFQANDEEPYEEDFEPRAEPAVFATARPVPEKENKPLAPKPEKPTPVCGPSDPSRAGMFGPAKLSSCKLQQAIVWSEILSKPVALRRN